MTGMRGGIVPGLGHGAQPETREHRSGKLGAERKLAFILCAPALVIMLAVTAFPILYAVWLSLHRADLRAPDENAFIGLENYVTVLTSPISTTSAP